MAVGTIFTEIDLDMSKFVAKQKKLLDDIKRVGVEAEKGLQQSFTNLGVTSDAVYQLMANKAIASYNRISASAKTSAAEQVRAHQSMVAKINAMNVEMTKNSLFETLGIKSQAAYKAQEAAIMSSYETIKKSGMASSEDLIRIERAKNEKLKELHKEMAGEHEKSMASMTRAVLRLYAEFYVLSSAGQYLGSFLMSGVKAIDDMKLSTIAVAAQITSMQGTTGDVTENYRKNLEYAKALVPILQQIDANSFANLSQVQKMNMAMTNQGVILDVNNQKQIESFTALTNAVALFTQGQDKEKQAAQEMRSLFSGQVRAGDMVAMQMDALIKKQGDYKDGLKGLVAEGKKHGDTLERMQPYLVGIIAASGDIQQTWSAVSSSIETAWSILQRGLFKDIYKDLTEQGSKAAKYMKDNTDEIVRSLNDIRDGFKFAAAAGLTFVGVLGLIEGIALAKAAWLALTAAISAGTVAITLQCAALDVWAFITGGKAFWAVTSLTGALKVMGGVMAAAFIGFEVGSWLNKFESVRKFGVAMVYGLIDAFEWLSKTISIGIEYLKVFRDVLSNPVNTKAIWDAGQARISVIKKQYEEEKKIRNEYAAEQFRNVTDQAIKEAKAKADIAKSTATPKIKAKAGVDDASNSAVKEAESVAKRIAEATRRAQLEIDGYNQTQYEKDLLRIKSEEEEWRKAKATEIDITKWKNAELTIAENKMQTETTKQALKDFDDWLKLEESKKKEQERLAKERADLPQKEADEARKMVTFYNDIRGMEEQYRNEKLNWIEKEAALKKSKGEEEVAVMKWVETQREMLRRENLKGIEEKFDYDNKYTKDTISNMGKVLDAAMSCYDKESSEYKRMGDLKKGVQIAEIAMEVAKNVQLLSFMAAQNAAYSAAMAKKAAGLQLTAAEAVLTQGTGDPYSAFARMAAMAAIVAGVLSAVGIAFGGFGGGGSSSVSSAPSYAFSNSVLGGEAGEQSDAIAKSWEFLQETYDMEYERLTKIYNEMKSLNENITGLVTSIIRTGSVELWTPVAVTSYPDWWGINESKDWTGIRIIDTALGWVQDIGKSILEGVFGGKTEYWSSGSGIGMTGGSVGEFSHGGGTGGYAWRQMHSKKKGGWFHSDKYSSWLETAPLDASVVDLMSKVYQDLSDTLIELTVGLGQDMARTLAYVFPGGMLTLNGMNAEQIGKAINEFFSAQADAAVQTLFGALLKGYQEVGESLTDTAVRLMVDKEIVLEVLDQTGQAYISTTENTIAFSEALIKLAGDLDTLVDISANYYDKFFTDEEKHLRLQEQLTTVLGSLNIALPETRQGYRALVEGLNLTTDTGREAYITLLKLADGADTYYTTLEEGAEKVKSAIELMAEAIDEVLSNLSSAINDQINLSKSMASQHRSMANTYRQIIDSITDTQNQINGRGTAGAGQRFGSLFATAMTGDATALQGLPQAAQDLLSESLKSSSTAEEYNRTQGKVLLALEEAKTVSSGMVNWNEYMASVYDIQTGLLEDMKAQLELPDPNTDILNQQAGLLENIATILQQQTAQIVSGNNLQALILHDQTGKIILANQLTTDQTGQIVLGNNWLTDLSGATKFGIAVAAAQAKDAIEATNEGAASTTASVSDLKSASLWMMAQEYFLEQAGQSEAATAAANAIQATAKVSELIAGGVDINSAEKINEYLREVETALIGNNTWEAIQARTAMAEIRKTTEDGLLTTAEAETTTKALGQLQDATAVQLMYQYSATKTGLSGVQTALNGQTVEIVNGNVVIKDQNGLIVSSNQLLKDQTGKIVIGNELTDDQTAQVITGNATQDAIKNIQNLNTAYSEEMLAALIAGESTQTNSLQGILAANNTTVSLIGQLVSLTQASEEARVQAEADAAAARIAAEEEQRQAAETARIAAETAAAAAALAAQVKAATATYNQQAATAESYRAQWDQFATSHASASFRETQEDITKGQAYSVTGYYSYSDAERAWLSQTVSAYQSAFAAAYDLWKAIPGHATGLDYVPKDDYLMRAHEGEAVLSPPDAARWRSGKTGSNSNVILIEEIRALRAEIKAGNVAIAKNTGKAALVLDRTLTKWDEQGIPAEATP